MTAGESRYLTSQVKLEQGKKEKGGRGEMGDPYWAGLGRGEDFSLPLPPFPISFLGRRNFGFRLMLRKRGKKEWAVLFFFKWT